MSLRDIGWYSWRIEFNWLYKIFLKCTGSLLISSVNVNYWTKFIKNHVLNIRFWFRSLCRFRRRWSDWNWRQTIGKKCQNFLQSSINERIVFIDWSFERTSCNLWTTYEIVWSNTNKTTSKTKQFDFDSTTSSTNFHRYEDYSCFSLYSREKWVWSIFDDIQTFDINS